MNNTQIALLKEEGYEVLPEVGYIKEITLLRPIASIWFNTLKKEFKLCIIGTEVNDDELENYQQELNQKIKLVKDLNNLAGEE